MRGSARSRRRVRRAFTARLRIHGHGPAGRILFTFLRMLHRHHGSHLTSLKNLINVGIFAQNKPTKQHAGSGRLGQIAPGTRQLAQFGFELGTASSSRSNDSRKCSATSWYRLVALLSEWRPRGGPLPSFVCYVTFEEHRVASMGSDGIWRIGHLSGLVWSWCVCVSRNAASIKLNSEKGIAIAHCEPLGCVHFHQYGHALQGSLCVSVVPCVMRTFVGTVNPPSFWDFRKSLLALTCYVLQRFAMVFRHRTNRCRDSSDVCG